jgi:hypothetical protein
VRLLRVSVWGLFGGTSSTIRFELGRILVLFLKVVEVVEVDFFFLGQRIF